MIPYLALLVVVVTLAYFGRIAKNDVTRRLSLISIFFYLIIFAGMRGYQVGTDTGTYKLIFLRSNIPGSVYRDEVGFGFLLWAVRTWTDSFSVFLIVIAAIVVSCYLLTIIRTTPRYETAIFVFIALGTYTFFFNGARQGIAAAICFAGLPFLLRRQLFFYVLSVALGALFHQTAWIALIVYPLASPHFRLRRLAMLAAATVTLVVFLQFFVNFAAEILDEKFAVYAQAGQGGGGVWVAFLFCQGVALYLFRVVVQGASPYYNRLLNIYMIGLVPALASTISGVNPSGVLRLHIYFSSVSILMWPVVFYYLRYTPNRFIVSFGFVFVATAFFILATTAFGKLIPYLFAPDFIL